VAAVAVAALVASGVGVVVARASGPVELPIYRTSLAAPFDGWNVNVTADQNDPDLLTLEFDSAVLHRRVKNVVWLPTSYRNDPSSYPVTYFLHGQVDNNSFGAFEGVYDQGVRSPVPFTSPGSGRGQAFGIGFGPTASLRRFLVVAIDMGDLAWCGHCFWTDGVGGKGVDSERHLLDEVIPLTEALFRVRTDRGGRALLGNSMGADGSLLVGFRHPDTFAFLGSLSATFPGFQDPATFGLWASTIYSLYTGDQGWGPPVSEEARYVGVDPLSLAGGMVGTGVEVMVANGDGCLPNDGQGECANEPVYGNPQQEVTFRRMMNIWTSELTQRGVRFTNIQREGAHTSALNADNFRRYFLPKINAVFAKPVPQPSVFSYSSIDQSFDVFGWSVSVNRPNLEFLHVLGASTDGTDITLAGTGSATVTTPRLGDAGKEYRIQVTPDGADTQEVVGTADGAGRITFTVKLGEPRAQNEMRSLVQAGLFQFPHTAIHIDRVDGPPPP